MNLTNNIIYTVCLKSSPEKQSRKGVAREEGRWKGKEKLFNGHRVSICQDEKVLEVDSHGNGHPGTAHLKIVKMVNFMLCVFTKHKKTPGTACAVGEGEGAPRPGGAQQKARQRGSWMPGGSCPSRWACPPWETATPTGRPRPGSSASGKQGVCVRGRDAQADP